jgi:hypothetical protein
MSRRVGRVVAIVTVGTVGACVMATSAAAPTSVDGPAVALAPAERQQLTHLGNCPVFPPDNPWNTPIDTLPVRARSAETIAKIQSVGGDFLHPDFGENPDYGIPYVIVPGDQSLVPIHYYEAGDESDPGPFPIPLDAPVEAGSDSHVLVLQQGSCRLYELFAASRSGGGWEAYSGAAFDLNSNALRPLGWTSADAAGLPILPGLVRYEEVASGRITHAIRVTFSQTQRKYILPATHYASDRTDIDLPPMGLRLRLRADYDISRFTDQALVIAQALQRYGFIVADNGSNWFFQGAPSPGWVDEELNQLKSLPGTAFEVVDTGPTLP